MHYSMHVDFLETEISNGVPTVHMIQMVQSSSIGLQNG